MQITKLFISGLSLSLLLALAGCENSNTTATTNDATTTALSTNAVKTSLEEESLHILSNQTYLTQKEVRDNAFIAPVKLKAYDINDTNASLNWYHDDLDDSSDGFFLFYTELEDGVDFNATKPLFDNSRIVNSPDQLNTLLSLLKPDTRYGARIASFKTTIDNGAPTNIDILLGDWNKTTTEFRTQIAQDQNNSDDNNSQQEPTLAEPDYRLWCENNESTVIAIENIDSSVDGVRIYRNIKGEARPGELVEDNITNSGEYIDNNNSNGLKPSYHNFEYTVKSYKDVNGTREESNGITKAAE
jgi:hypothetical protein